MQVETKKRNKIGTLKQATIIVLMQSIQGIFFTMRRQQTMKSGTKSCTWNVWRPTKISICKRKRNKLGTCWSGTKSCTSNIKSACYRGFRKLINIFYYLVEKRNKIVHLDSLRSPINKEVASECGTKKEHFGSGTKSCTSKWFYLTINQLVKQETEQNRNISSLFVAVENKFRKALVGSWKIRNFTHEIWVIDEI